MLDLSRRSLLGATIALPLLPQGVARAAAPFRNQLVARELCGFQAARARG